MAHPLDLSLREAGLAQAVEALNAVEWVQARCEGTVPDRKVTLILDAAPLGDVLDALAALYGVQWAERAKVIVFSPRKPGSAGSTADSPAPAPAGQARPAPAPLPATRAVPGSAGAQMPEAPVGGTAEVTQEAVRMLRGLGIGVGAEPQPGDPAQQAQIASTLATLFNPMARQRMAQAGPEAYRLGVRVCDMPPAVRSMVLEWQMGLYARQVDVHLWNAVQPFNVLKYLDAVMYLSYAQDADGLPRGAPSLALRGPNWSNTWALAPSR